MRLQSETPTLSSPKSKRKAFIPRDAIARKVDASRNTVSAIKVVWDAQSFALVKAARTAMRTWPK